VIAFLTVFLIVANLLFAVANIAMGNYGQAAFNATAALALTAVTAVGQ